MMPSSRICRLYLLTPPVIGDDERFAALLAETLDGAIIAALQIRLKDRAGQAATDDAICALAERLLPITRSVGTKLIINDRPDLAAATGADGVHVGSQDASCLEARALLGAEAIIGVTCQASLAEAHSAAGHGADYVAFGSFYPSQTKDSGQRAKPELLRRWSATNPVPAVAIGGISPENAAPLLGSGAAFVAASSSVWDCVHGAKAAIRAFARLFEQVEQKPSGENIHGQDQRQ